MPRGVYEAGAAWTERRVAILRRMWAGGASASDIARALGGVTRNAVIGKVRKLGLKDRAPGARARTGSAAARPAPAKRTPRAPAIPRRCKRDPNPGAGLAFRTRVPKPRAAQRGDSAPDPAALARSVAWADLKPGACVWILGAPDGAASRCCGAAVDPAAAGRALRARYCAAHGAAAIAAVQPKPVSPPPAARRAGARS